MELHRSDVSAGAKLTLSSSLCKVRATFITERPPKLLFAFGCFSTGVLTWLFSFLGKRATAVMSSIIYSAHLKPQREFPDGFPRLLLSNQTAVQTNVFSKVSH